MATAANKRKHPRRPLRKLDGVILTKRERRSIEFRPVDISVHGLGIIAFEQLAPSTEVLLVIGDAEIGMRIVWALPEDGAAPFYQYGLQVLNESDNVQKAVLNLKAST